MQLCSTTWHMIKFALSISYKVILTLIARRRKLLMSKRRKQSQSPKSWSRIRSAKSVTRHVLSLLSFKVRHACLNTLEYRIQTSIRRFSMNLKSSTRVQVPNISEKDVLVHLIWPQIRRQTNRCSALNIRPSWLCSFYRKLYHRVSRK